MQRKTLKIQGLPLRKTCAHHGVGIGAGYREQEPETETLEETPAVRADEIAHDAPVEARDTNAQYGAQHKEERVHDQYESLLGVPRGKRYSHDGHQLAEERLVQVRFMGRGNKRKVFRDLFNNGCGGW